MSTTSQFFSGGASIKAIQRGTVNATNAGATVTITAVNTAKTELRFLGGSGAAGTSAWGAVPRLVLTNSTTITATTTGADGGVTVSWELTEWN